MLNWTYTMFNHFHSRYMYIIYTDYLATVKTQMKCWIILHFIRVCTVYLQVNEKNLQGQKYIILISYKYKMAKCTLIRSTCLGRSIRMKRVYKAFMTETIFNLISVQYAD